MTIRWTEEEARAFGCRKDRKGNWKPPERRDSGSTVSQAGDPRVVSESKRNVQRKAKPKRKDGTKEKGVSKGERGPRFRIIVTSYRQRDADPDNIIPKWYIDEIVRAGLIPDDSLKYVESILKQVVVSKDEPKTVIEVFRCP